MTKSKTNTTKPETVAPVAAKTTKAAKGSPIGETAVTPEAKLQLKQCEDTIRQNEGSLFSVGRNLGKISSEGLYKAAGFTEFAVYTKDRWGMSDKYAYRLIKAAKCLDTLTSHEATGTWVLPRNESQIRPIAQLKEEQWVSSWEKVMAKHGNRPFTAEDVKLVLNPEQASLDTCPVVPLSVFRPAIVASGSAIVLIHNHPSGDATESQADIKVTRDLMRAGQLLKIEVLDHLIIAGNEYRSLKALGYFY